MNETELVEQILRNRRNSRRRAETHIAASYGRTHKRRVVNTTAIYKPIKRTSARQRPTWVDKVFMPYIISSTNMTAKAESSE